MAVLYRITNEVNKKLYFGQTIRQSEERKREYFKYGIFPNNHIKNSFNKYGKENFEFDVMFECPEEMLDVCEELLIYLLDTQNPDKGYNKDSGGNLSMSGEAHPSWRHDLDNDVLVDEYVNQELSCGEIARKYNTTNATVICRLNKLGIDTSRDKSSRYDLDDDVLVDEYVNQELSCREVARIHNTSDKTIKNRLNRLGIDTSRDKSSRDDLDDDVLVDEYVNQELSCNEIARIHNTAVETIRRRLNNRGIDTSRDKNVRDDLNDDILVDEYVNQGLNCCEIARKYDTSNSTVKSRLNNRGIDTSRDYNAPRDDLDDDVLVDEYVNQGLSCSEIARKYNASHSTIRRRLNKLGIDTSQTKKNYRDDLDDDVLVDEYVNQGLSCSEIARKYNASHSTIRRRLNKLGIDTSHNASKNTTGFYRVSQKKAPSYKQGFCYVYSYSDNNGKCKSISAIDIKKLEVKVKERGLTWRKL